MNHNKTPGTGKRKTLTNEGLTPLESDFLNAHIGLGLSQTDAYRKIRPKVANPAQCAKNMLMKPRVMAALKARQAALTLVAQRKASKTIEDVIAELELIGFARLGDFITTQDDGTAIVDFSAIHALPEAERSAKLAALGEFTVDAYEEGSGRGEDRTYVPVKKIKLKLLPKAQALVDLGRHLGGFKSSTVLENAKGADGQPVPFATVTVPADPLEAARLYQKLVAGKA